MKFNKILEIDKKLINGGSNSKLIFDGVNIVFQLFDVDNDELCYEIFFEGVIAFKHFMEGFALISESYEQLIEIELSEWLKELRKIMPNRFDFWKPKHFALYTHNDAQYEIVAKNCSIKNLINR